MANGNGTPDPTTNCGVGIDNRRRIMALEKCVDDQWTALDHMRNSSDKAMATLRMHMDESMDKLRNRLPVWATLVLSILTGLVGVLLALSIQGRGGS